MDDEKCGILVLLNLNATFHNLVQELLSEDLRPIAIVDDVLEYLSDHLKGGKYCVQIGGFSSETVFLRTGVLQGSVLEPVLFCIYTIGISSILHNL